LKWQLPSSPLDAILISRLNVPPKATVRELFDVSEISFLKRLPGKTTSYTDSDTNSGEVYYYAFYTVKQQTAVYCGYIEVALLEDVKNLKAVNKNGDIILTWDWPPNIDYVKVFRTPVYTDKESKIYTREQYKSMMLDKVGPKRCKYRYKVHAVRCYPGGKEVISSTGALVEVTGGRLPEITYKLNIRSKDRWKLKSPKIVEVECDISQVDFLFSGLSLRKKKFARLKDKWDGKEVDRWQGDESNQLTKVVLRDLKPELVGKTYYRVFLVGDDEEIVKIQSPPISELKV